VRFAAICVLLLLSAVLAGATVDVSLQLQLGNPSGATADTNNHSHYLVQRPVEALDYNDSLGEPNWASWDLTTSDVGSVNRSSSFYTDTNLPSNFYWVTDADYNGVGNINFNRGHLCPSEDRTDTTNDNKMVFFMSNIMPQSAVNNQGVWGTFEGYCRSLTNNYELLIICGPGGFGTNKIPSGKAYIGSFVWKIAVAVPLGGGTAASRITTGTRVIALEIPNDDSATNAWTTYVTNAAQVQADTGLTFFTALAPDIAAALRAKVDGQTYLPPGITAFSPPSGATNTSVVITGTNFTGAVLVTFNGASASYTVNSSTQITATVPTNATTGAIAVTTAGGTTTSTTNFTVTTGGIPSPAISSFSPASGATNTSVVITGTNFTGATQVAFNGTSAAFAVNNNTQITATVPAGATTGAIAVTTAGGTATSTTNFTVTTAAPSIAAFSPTSGMTNTSVVITGTNFTGTTQVAFNGASAAFTVNNNTQITATVPASATTGSLSVTTPNGTAVTSSNFTVIPNVIASSYSGVLLGWDVSGQSSFGPSPLAPTTNAPNLSVIGLTRGSGVTTSGTGKTKAWGGTGFTSLSASAAVTANQYVYFGLSVSNGYKVSITNLSRFDYYRSPSGATNGTLQFQVGTGAFTDITNYTYSGSSSGATNAPIDLSGYATLQNIGAGTNVTFRIVNYNAGSSGGTWYVYDYASSTAPDLAINGTITSISGGGSTPTILPGFQSFSVGAGNATLVITGATATSYTILASTNLGTTNWTTLLTTNSPALPFTYTDTNQLPLRFYRVQNP
jgi:DNA/RNA endonuclease G (NUC1)